MILADFGTTYSKIQEHGQLRVVRTQELPRGILADLACGHNARERAHHYENELVALARGARRLIQEESFICVDVGSRDITMVRFEDGEYQDCDWNYQCGALAGFAVELMGHYFELDFSQILPMNQKIQVTCGILGLGALFDQISEGRSKEEAAAMFIAGLADSVHHFCRKPARFYLSGGLCENPLFLRSFPCEVVPLGRCVQLEGLTMDA